MNPTITEQTLPESKVNFDINRNLYDTADNHQPKLQSLPGINQEVIQLISSTKKEPEWMKVKRFKAFELFKKTPIPTWGPDLSELDLSKIIYFMDPNTTESNSWDDVPEEIKQTFDKLGIPEAEKKALAGVGAQFDSGMVYHNLQQKLKDQGVIFENMDLAIHKYPELVKEYFMTSCIPINDHKFIMLHAAVWSGGTFIYVPKNVKVDLPLQAYFRMNGKQGGQFEHTLIIVDEGAELHYIEGCSSPRYQQSSLHAGCVEIFVKEGATMRYTSIENWSRNVYNLNTKRALVDKNAKMIWTNGNMGCLTGDSQIFTTKNGPTPIKDIKINEEVFAWDEKTNSIVKKIVTAKKDSGKKKVFCIKAGGRELKASANHPFLTLIRKKVNPNHKKAFFHFSWKSLGELKEGDVIGIIKKVSSHEKIFKIPQFNYNHKTKSMNQYKSFTMDSNHLYDQDLILPNNSSDDFMWFLGILLGDGFVDCSNNKINIALHKIDDLRKTFIKVVKKLFNYDITNREERYVEIYSKVLCETIKKIGFTGTAKTKKIPSWVFTLPQSQIVAFLAGYFDADGHPSPNALAFTSINRKILEDVRTLAIQCGYFISQIFQHMPSGRRNVVGNMCNASGYWRIHLNGKNVVNFPSRSKKKKKKIVKITSRRNYNRASGLNFQSKCNDEIGFATIKSIESIGVQDTYDIEVKGAHNFIAEGMIVHNSARTMLYPCSILRGVGAHSESLGIAFAGSKQDQDTGSKVIHAASNTTSIIKAKSISKDGGISSYRGLVKVMPNAKNIKSNVQCDALLLDEKSVSKTYPYMKINSPTATVGHEASVSKVSDEQLFYLQSRGLSEEQATKVIVSGFISPIVKALPLEYAIELNKLIELEVQGM